MIDPHFHLKSSFWVSELEHELRQHHCTVPLISLSDLFRPTMRGLIKQN